MEKPNQDQHTQAANNGEKDEKDNNAQTTTETDNDEDFRDDESVNSNQEGQERKTLVLKDAAEEMVQGQSPTKDNQARKSARRTRIKKETDPLMMSLPELAKLLQTKAARRKAKLAQRQRAALLGFLPPGMLPPAKLLGKVVPAGTESGGDIKDTKGTSSAASVGAGKSVGTKPITVKRRKSLLEHMESKMEAQGHKSILFRFVAIGSHEENPYDLILHQEKIIHTLNIAPEVEHLTGLLLVYPKHFIQVLEGSEMILANYIAQVAYEFEKKPTLPNLEENNKVLRAKMVILCYVKVDQRLAHHWSHTATINPTHDNLMGIKGYHSRLFELIKLSWILTILARDFIKELPPIIITKNLDETSKDFMTSAPIMKVNMEQIFPAAEVKGQPEEVVIEDDVEALARQLKELNDEHEKDLLVNEIFNVLPSVAILQYFLKDKERCPNLLTPQQYIDKYWGLSTDVSWRDIAWPVPSRLHPYD